MSHNTENSNDQLAASLRTLRERVLTEPPSREALVAHAIAASSDMLVRVARRCARYVDLPSAVPGGDIVDIARSVERTMLEELIDNAPECDSYLLDWEIVLRTKTQLAINAQFPRATRARNQRALAKHRQAIVDAPIDPRASHPSTARQR